jgi:hypothetical protein
MRGDSVGKSELQEKNSLIRSVFAAIYPWKTWASASPTGASHGAHAVEGASGDALAKHRPIAWW